MHTFVSRLIRKFGMRTAATESSESGQLLAYPIQPPTKLSTIQILLVAHCNLGCMGCSVFAPLAKPSYADPDLVSDDIFALSQKTGGKVDVINLLGGEPLLHPKLTTIFPAVRKNFPESKIALVTNGILLPKQKEDFWVSMHENEITLEPTKYPDIDWERIEKISRQYGVTMQYHAPHDMNEGKKTTWYMPIDPSGRGGPMESNFKKCPRAASGFFVLDKGRLYSCCIAPVMRHFNEYFGQNIPIEDADFISLEDVDSIDDIIRAWARPKPLCRYCKLDEWSKDHPWQRSRRQISEWT